MFCFPNKARGEGEATDEGDYHNFEEHNADTMAEIDIYITLHYNWRRKCKTK